ERADAVARDRVPETVVAAGPDDPVVAPLHFVGREGDAAIHFMEVIFVSGRKALYLSFRLKRFVQHLRRLLLGTTPEEQQRQRACEAERNRESIDHGFTPHGGAEPSNRLKHGADFLSQATILDWRFVSRMLRPANSQGQALSIIKW